MKKQSPTRIVTQLAVFTALSYVLYMFVKAPLPFLFPSFLDLQFSDMPALLAGFMMGPQYGVIVIALRTLLKLPFSTTSCVGELADFVIGTAFVLTSALYYRKHRSKKGALVSLALGVGATTVTAMLANYLVLIPFYLQAFFGGSWEPLLGMMRVLFPAVTQQSFYAYYIFLSVLPFNLLRGVICSVVTFLVYKSLQRMFDKMFPPKKEAVARPVSASCSADRETDGNGEGKEISQTENITQT